MALSELDNRTKIAYQAMWNFAMAQPTDDEGIYHFRLPVYVNFDGQAELMDLDAGLYRAESDTTIIFDPGDFFEMFLAITDDSRFALHWTLSSTDNGPYFEMDIHDSFTGMPIPDYWQNRGIDDFVHDFGEFVRLELLHYKREPVKPVVPGASDYFVRRRR